MSAVTPPQDTPTAQTAPTEIGLFLKAWAPPVVTLVGAISVALTSWALLTQRVEALESKVAQVMDSRQADHELLLQMNTRLKLLVCRLDPPNCPRE